MHEHRWAVEHSAGPAGPFHERELPEPARREVWIHDVDRPALVLGSAQPESDVDRAVAVAHGIEIVRRRSGGGAVLLVPGEVLWIDIVLPAGDPLWVDDVTRSFFWLGDAWVDALDQPGLAVHRRGLVPTTWSRRVCFAGVGPGEVCRPPAPSTVVAEPSATGPAGGRWGPKVVGISQRRTRRAARFQCAVVGTWDPGLLGALVGVPAADIAGAAAPVELLGLAERFVAALAAR